MWLTWTEHGMDQEKDTEHPSERTVIMSGEEIKAYLDQSTRKLDSSELPQPNFRVLLNPGNAPERALIIVYRALDFLDGQGLREEIGKLLFSQIQTWDVDLSGIGFCDSATIGFCIMLHMTIQRAGGKTIIHVLRDSQIHTLIRQSRLDQILNIQFD